MGIFRRPHDFLSVKKSYAASRTRQRVSGGGTNLQKKNGVGAGDGNRTHISSLGSSHSTIELHLLDFKLRLFNTRKCLIAIENVATCAVRVGIVRELIIRSLSGQFRLFCGIGVE